MEEEKSIVADKRDKALASGETQLEPSVDRILSDTKSLSEDVLEWLRLKVQLIQIEVHERIAEEVNAILSSIMVLSIIVIAMFLGLMALGLYIGELVGDDALGLAIVAAFAAIVALIMGRTQPQWIGDVMFTLIPRRWLGKRKASNDKARKGET
jgi:uncharacterized membrane protein YqjE